VSEARSNILRRLRAKAITAPPSPPTPKTGQWSTEQRIARFCERQAAVHGEVHRLVASQWREWLASELPKRGLNHVLTGTEETGKQFAAMNMQGIELVRFENPIEDWKNELFARVDVAITRARCAIAETGSLVLWPDADEPRLMSLAPPVHIALLRAESIYQTFAEVIEAEQWAKQMPTNALLISGPSKTADIEQTLAYGIHGPKQLITLILE
jgi:L-lactate dehydrogenase complex protein LldG